LIGAGPPIPTMADADTTPEPCACCKGTGKQKTTMTVFGSSKSPTVREVGCVWCGGRGAATAAQAAEHRYWQECWCECACEVCGARGMGALSCGHGERPEAEYHEDWQTPWKWCCAKHHYHCGRCRKLLQIG